MGGGWCNLAPIVNGTIFFRRRPRLLHLLAVSRHACLAFAGDRKGATAIEYAMIISGIFLVIVTAVYGLSDEVSNMFNTVSNNVRDNM